MMLFELGAVVYRHFPTGKFNDFSTRIEVLLIEGCPL
jgi:hypothetical protein